MLLEALLNSASDRELAKWKCSENNPIIIKDVKDFF